LRNLQLRTAGKNQPGIFSGTPFIESGLSTAKKIPEEARRRLPVAWREKVDDVLHEAVNGALASN
jgi:hypothetical protein